MKDRRLAFASRLFGLAAHPGWTGGLRPPLGRRYFGAAPLLAFTGAIRCWYGVPAHMT